MSDEYDGDLTVGDINQIKKVESLIASYDLPVLEQYLPGFTGICKHFKAQAYIIEKNIILPGLLRIVKEKSPSTIAIYSWICLVNCAIHSVSHKSLLSHHALEIALETLHLLDGRDDTDKLDCGLSAAFLICRMVGKDEEGPGPAAIRGNTKLTNNLAWILKEVLDVGEGGTVIGARWDPANIVLDVATLSVSDQNKPLLADFVPLIYRALQERTMFSDGDVNARLVKYSVQALSQLIFEPTCKAEMLKIKQQLIDVIQQSASKIEGKDRETEATAKVLVDSLKNDGAPRRSSLAPSKLRGVVTAAAKKPGLLQRLAGAKPKGGEIQEEVSPTVPTKHVMISYQWDAKPIAREIQRRLAEAGLKTWFDENDMGANLIDSMAEAVDNAFAVVCLISPKYKESANCRKECESADISKVPLIFVKVDLNYTPQAWLKLVMLKALYIECGSVEQVGENFPLLMRQVKQAAQTTAVDIKVANTEVSEPTSPSKSETKKEPVVQDELLTKFMNELQELKKGQDEIKKTQEQILALLSKLNVS